MRGLVRFDKQDAIDFFKEGKGPTFVSKELEIPVSTVLTWYSEFKRTKVKSEAEIQRQLKEYATVINIAEAKIMTAASKVVIPSISDDEWFKFQAVVTKQLQDLIIKNV